MNEDFYGANSKECKCVRLVEQLLKEDENILKHLKANNRPTKAIVFRIQRLKYALDIISDPPSWRDYHLSEEELKSKYNIGKELL